MIENTQDNISVKTTKDTKEAIAARENKLFEAYELVKDTVAIIKILRKTPILIDNNVDIREVVIGHGSGFICKIGEIPFIFTAHHVIGGIKKNERIGVLVRQKDGKWIEDPSPTIFFEDPEHDIAALLLSVDGKNLSSANLPPPVFDPTTLLKVGSLITYCGFPYISDNSEFIPIFQQGMIAGIDTGRFKDSKVAYIIDGMVNPGNSGGPAFVATSNDVIGIISAYITPMMPGPRLVLLDGDQTIDILSRSAGLGLVVPINYAVDMLRTQLKNLKEVLEKEKKIESASSQSIQENQNLKKVMSVS